MTQSLKPQRAHQQHDVKRRTVLIVDDDSAAADVLSLRLSRQGFRTRVIEQGAAVLETARTERPDLILLDLRLPDVDGLTLCQLLVDDEETAGVPIIIDPKGVDYRKYAGCACITPNRLEAGLALGTTIRSTAEGLAAAKERPPRLILLDIRLPDRDGFDALVEFRDGEYTIQDLESANGTRVNGVVTQQGNTRDLVHDIPQLIEYLSSFMTLGPGDVILTGTPEGVVNVNAGDEVVCEIDGLGRLVNTIVGDAWFGR